MGRRCTFNTLPADQRTALQDCVRAHRHLTLNEILAVLEERGFKGIFRSTLHRYIQQLNRKDVLYANPTEGTIITIIERGTGEVRTVKSSAARAAIEEMILKLTPPDPVS